MSSLILMCEDWRDLNMLGGLEWFFLEKDVKEMKEYKQLQKEE